MTRRRPRARDALAGAAPLALAAFALASAGCFDRGSAPSSSPPREAPPVTVDSSGRPQAVERIAPQGSPAPLRREIEEFLREPGLKNLDALKQLCRAGDFKWDEAEVLLGRLSGTDQVNGARFLLFMLENCSDGAITRDLEGILGVDLLLDRPRLLLQAISEEKPHPSVIRSLADSHGKSGESVFVDCDSRCVPGVEDFYGNRISAIEGVPSAEELRAARESLLQELRRSREEWIRKFRSVKAD